MTTKYNALPKAYDGPARIWLQWEEFEDEEIGVTWSRDKINESDVEYITVGLFETMQRGYESQLDALRERVGRLEAAANQAITDCIPLLSWVDGDDTAVEMVLNIANRLGEATAEGASDGTK